MSQVHETLARDWLAMCERKERPPLTVWETEQLLRGWLEREQLRGMLKWQRDLRENAVNEIERLRARLAEAERLIAKAASDLRYAAKCMNPSTPAARWWNETAAELDAFRTTVSAVVLQPEGRGLMLTPPDLNTPFDAPIRAQQARDDAANVEGLRRQREYMATDEFKELVRRAYIQGATDVHENYQPDRHPDFNEAADDYAATVTVAVAPEAK